MNQGLILGPGGPRGCKAVPETAPGASNKVWAPGTVTDAILGLQGPDLGEQMWILKGESTRNPPEAKIMQTSFQGIIFGPSWDQEMPAKTINNHQNHEK